MDAVETLPLPQDVMEAAAVDESHVVDPPPASSPHYLKKKLEKTLELGEVVGTTAEFETHIPEEPATPTEFQPPVTGEGDGPPPKSSPKIPDPSASEMEKACVGKIVF